MYKEIPRRERWQFSNFNLKFSTLESYFDEEIF
jgi:hypothetical protein